MGAGRKAFESGFVLSGEPSGVELTQPRGFLGAGPEGAALVKTPPPCLCLRASVHSARYVVLESKNAGLHGQDSGAGVSLSACGSGFLFD